MLHFITNYNNIIKFCQITLHNYQKKAAADRILTAKSLCEYIISLYTHDFRSAILFCKFPYIIIFCKIAHFIQK